MVTESPRSYGRSLPAVEEELVIPYLPSLELCRRWFALCLGGLSSDDAWQRLTRMPADESAVDRRHALRALSRSLVAGAHGQDPLSLTVPILGGSSAVKRGHPERWRISMHGDWIRIHRGALSAAYSATPYFSHYMPLLDEIYSRLREGYLFRDLTSALFDIVRKAINLPNLSLLTSYPDQEVLMTICGEKDRDTYTSLTVFDVIFRRGPELPLILYR